MTLIELYRDLLGAVGLHKGLAYGAAVSSDGLVDVIGAYGYQHDDLCREAVDELRKSAQLASPAALQLAGAASERATEVFYRDTGNAPIMRQLIRLNDRNVGETPKARLKRVAVYLTANLSLGAHDEAA